MEFITDLEVIKELSERNEKENWKFRRILKYTNHGIDDLDETVHFLYKKVADKINCQECANCCKTLKVLVSLKEIETIAGNLGVSLEDFIEKYIKYHRNEDEYFFNSVPCPFLKDNLCTIYSYRPGYCKSFPNLENEDIIFSLTRVILNCDVCPIVFNVYELLKKKV